MRAASLVVLLACFSLLQVYAAPAGFVILPLGTSGGVDEGSMSGYALAAKPTDNTNPAEFVLFESGSFVNGLRVASSLGVLNNLGVPHYLKQCQTSTSNCSDWGYFLNVMIKGYFVTHPHLDHYSGLVIASASDSTGPSKNNQKKIYGLTYTTTSISQNIFNWVSWPNMENVYSPGNVPISLSTYASYTMTEQVEVPNVTSSLHVTAYPLSHSTIGNITYGVFNSTAFFFRSGNAVSDSNDRVFIGFGDTGPDSVEGSTRLLSVWKAAAPLWINNQLMGIMIECSYDNSRSNSLLFGHLTPYKLNEELTNFAAVVNQTSPIGIRGLNVIITHVKTSLFTDTPETLILSQLNANNSNFVNYIMPQQARLITLNPDNSVTVAPLPPKCPAPSSSTGLSSSGFPGVSSSTTGSSTTSSSTTGSSTTGSSTMGASSTASNGAGRSVPSSMMSGFVGLVSTLFVGLRLSMH